LDNFDNKGRKVCCKVSLYNKSLAVAEMDDSALEVLRRCAI